MSLTKDDIKEIQQFVEEFGIKNDKELKEAVMSLGIGKAVIAGCEAIEKRFGLDAEEVLQVFKGRFESFLEDYDKGLQEVFFKK